MTKLLEQAFEALGRMPTTAQDEIARALLGLSTDADVPDIEPEHMGAVLEGLSQSERGEFAAGSPDEVLDLAFCRGSR